MSWTDERISLLKRLCGEGKSAREIATALGEGVTRNAVIGKINRMKLAERKAGSGKSKPASSGASKPKKAPPKPKASASPRKSTGGGMAPPSPPSSPSPPSPPPTPPPPAAEPASPPPSSPQESQEPVAPLIREPDEDGDVDEDVKGASLFGEGGCKWPIGHPGEEDFHFCGERRYETLPYCSNHAQEAYQMNDRRRGRNS